MATQTLTYPEPAELKEIEQELLPVLVEDDPIFDEFPMVESDRNRLRWEQMDNFKGLQQVRGLNGAPRRVKMVGANVYDYEPGVYGEFTSVDEKDLTERRELGTWDQPVSIDDLIGRAQRFLLQRRIDRIRQIIWTLVTSGTFAISDALGRILHTDVFNLKTFTAGTAWSNLASSTPTANIRTVQLLQRGQSVDFGSGSKLYANLATINNILANQNPNDFFGRRVNGGATLNSLGDINTVLSANNLPELVVYDRTYYDESGTLQLFIPDNKAVLIGRRTNGAKLGEYRMTRNANNPRLEPGAYTRVIDHGEDSVPRRVDVHDGHNGGPVVYFPGSIVVMSV